MSAWKAGNMDKIQNPTKRQEQKEALMTYFPVASLQGTYQDTLAFTLLKTWSNASQTTSPSGLNDQKSILDVLDVLDDDLLGDR